MCPVEELFVLRDAHETLRRENQGDDSNDKCVSAWFILNLKKAQAVVMVS